MRLIKLLAYSLLGYVLYELYLGMTEGAQAGGSLQHRGRQAPRRDGSAATSGGTGQSRQVRVDDATGAKATRTVGRGVVQ